MGVDAQAIKREALRMGFDQCGICAASPPARLDAYRDWIGKGYHGSMSYLARHLTLKADPQHLLPGARSVIAVALNYNQPNPVVKGMPRIARYALGRDYHKVLRAKLRKLEAWLAERHPGSRHRACVDSAPIMERDFAQMAGLGFFGKNTMLIDSKRGSWFFIGLLLTTLDLAPDAPSVGTCGKCTKCIDACPTGALINEDGRWQLDARRCISYLTIEHKGDLPPEADLHGWTFGCDVCQEVCPFNQPRASQPMRAVATAERAFMDRREWPDLMRLSVIGDEEWDLRTRGSAIRRVGQEGIRRNARANLGGTQ